MSRCLLTNNRYEIKLVHYFLKISGSEYILQQIHIIITWVCRASPSAVKYCYVHGLVGSFWLLKSTGSVNLSSEMAAILQLGFVTFLHTFTESGLLRRHGAQRAERHDERRRGVRRQSVPDCKSQGRKLILKYLDTPDKLLLFFFRICSLTESGAG